MTTSPQSHAISLAQLVRHVRPAPRSIRSVRYRGEDRAVRLSAMPAEEAHRVQALYALLQRTDAAIRAVPGDADAAQEIAEAFDLERALQVARSLGASSGALPDDVRQSWHDVRGGALTSLLIEIQRARTRRTANGLRALRVLTADHLKVMRNALLELDDAKRNADLAPAEHAIERLEETLARVTGEGPAGGVRVAIQRTFVGGVTMSCVELGALDRAALNVVNNAVRHAATGRVEIGLVPASEGPDPDLCICVANAIEPEHASRLKQRFGEDLERIFLEPFSTTGSGDGLKITVDFVSAAYGLVRAEDAVRSGLVGATIDEAWFLAWLKWPAVA